MDHCVRERPHRVCALPLPNNSVNNTKSSPWMNDWRLLIYFNLTFVCFTICISTRESYVATTEWLRWRETQHNNNCCGIVCVSRSWVHFPSFAAPSTRSTRLSADPTDWLTDWLATTLPVLDAFGWLTQLGGRSSSRVLCSVFRRAFSQWVTVSLWYVIILEKRPIWFGLPGCLVENRKWSWCIKATGGQRSASSFSSGLLQSPAPPKLIVDHHESYCEYCSQEFVECATAS